MDFAETNEEAVVVDSIVAKRITHFLQRPNYPGTIKSPLVKTIKRGSSLLNQCEIRCLDEDKCEWFVCLLDPCSDIWKPVAINARKPTHHLPPSTSRRRTVLNRRKRGPTFAAWMASPSRWTCPLLHSEEIQSGGFRYVA